MTLDAQAFEQVKCMMAIAFAERITGGSRTIFEVPSARAHAVHCDSRMEGIVRNWLEFTP
jgi:hypothetical protein